MKILETSLRYRADVEYVKKSSQEQKLIFNNLVEESTKVLICLFFYILASFFINTALMLIEPLDLISVLVIFTFYQNIGWLLVLKTLVYILSFVVC